MQETTTSLNRALDLFGDGREPTATRDRLIVAALELFHAHGFHAVGLDQILAEVGVTKTTFYNHFASKDDLAAEAIQLREVWETQAFKRDLYELASDTQPRTLLITAFDVVDRWFRHPDFSGCLFLNACHEFPSPYHPVRQAASNYYIQTSVILGELAEQAGASDPQGLGTQLTLLIEGAFAMRQVTGNPESALLAKRIAQVMIDEACARE